ncbi:MAG: DNA primase [bacterium]
MEIPREIIDEIRSRNDIVEVVKEHLTLRPSGKNFKALCPFHSEKTPSFIVNSEKQIFHCFGCGEGGNVYSFVMKMEKVGFPEAVRILAARAGVEHLLKLPPLSERQSLRERVCDVNERVVEYYHNLLLNSEAGARAREYLARRGIGAEAIQRFKLGYAPDSWNAVISFGRRSGISEEDLLRAGLVVKGRDGNSYYDRFRQRLIFPIWDGKNRVVALGGRALDDSLPKYINSPETPAYNKSSILYGLNWARREIQERDAAILVEGYMDCVALHQVGITNAVASLGTSLSREHVGLLRRYARRVFIAYDSDSAGVAATLRGLDLFLEAGVQVKVVPLPEGMDPDSFIRKEGKGAFDELLRKSLPFFEFRLGRAVEGNDITTAEGKTKVVAEVIPTLVRMRSAIERQEGVKLLAERLGLDEGIILDEFKRGRGVNVGRIARVIVEGRNIPAHIRAERDLVGYLLTDSSLVPMVWEEELAASEFSDDSYRAIMNAIYSLAEERGDYTVAMVMDYLEPRLQRTIAEILEEDKKFSGSVEVAITNRIIPIDRVRCIKDCIRTIRCFKAMGAKSLDELQYTSSGDDELIRRKRQLLALMEA